MDILHEIFWRKRTISRGQSFLACLILLAVLIGIFVSLPSLGPRESGTRTICINNIANIAKALRGYYDANACFPPPYIADEQGHPMHSWRVLILPYMERKDIYAAYRFDEPWDGPNNRKLLEVALEVIRCPETGDEASPTDAYYLAVVGPETMWPPEGGLTVERVTDGIENTIMLVEVRDSGIHWMEPRDLEFDTMSFKINDAAGNAISSNHGLFGPDRPGAYVALADGSVEGLDVDTPPALVKRLLTANGGEPLPDDWNE